MRDWLKKTFTRTSHSEPSAYVRIHRIELLFEELRILLVSKLLPKGKTVSDSIKIASLSPYGYTDSKFEFMNSLEYPIHHDYYDFDITINSVSDGIVHYTATVKATK
jgi:hypothetical protein